MSDNTYGNYRKPTVPGIFGLSLGVSVLVAVAMLAVMVLTILGQWVTGLVLLLVSVVLVAPLLIPSSDGRTLYARMAARSIHRRATKKGLTALRQGPAGFTPNGQCKLPGIGADTELLEAEDAYGVPFGVIKHATTKQYTVVFECQAAGAASVDQHVIEGQVVQYAHFLSSLGREGAGIVGAQVTIETVPDTGERLRRATRAGVVEDAPAFSLLVLEEAVRSYPVGSALITTRYAITFSAHLPGLPGVRDDEAVIADIGSRMPTLLARLRVTGAGASARACRAQEIIDSTRAAFDPSAAADIEAAKSEEGGTGLTWSEAGPLSADAQYEQYRHDGAYSVSWVMVEPPRGTTYAVSLKNLLSPHPDIARKRVSILYRFEDPVASAQAVEQDVNLAMFAATQGNRVTARSRADVAAAQQTAREEAQGAALVRFGLIATATVLEEKDLPLAKRTMQTLTAGARLRMRPAKGSQDTTFVAGLPLGVVLPYYTMLPPALRDVF